MGLVGTRGVEDFTFNGKTTNKRDKNEGNNNGSQETACINPRRTHAASLVMGLFTI
jgi:hypothetical protein